MSNVHIVQLALCCFSLLSLFFGSLQFKIDAVNLIIKYVLHNESECFPKGATPEFHYLGSNEITRSTFASLDYICHYTTLLQTQSVRYPGSKLMGHTAVPASKKTHIFLRINHTHRVN
jgi:hypothetical protein